MTRFDNFARIRAEEFGDLRGAYFDAASMAPLPARSRAASDTFNRARSQAHAIAGEDFARPIQDTRQACAALIGADPSEIALGASTSFGINVAAMGLDVPDGATVLVPEREFPANIYPWMFSDRLRLERVPATAEGFPDEELLLERLGHPDVAAVSVSSVQFSNGYAIDLERLGRACREAGVFLVVDAIQSLGQIPLDVSSIPVDIVATGGHKWLCGPFGAGFFYARREIQDRLRPASIGWQSLQASQHLESVIDYAPEFVSDARRYEQGTPPFQDFAALAASVNLILDAGVEEIRQYLATLLDPLRQWLADAPDIEVLSPSDESRGSAIISFVPPSVETVHRRLREAGVICSLREGAIRVAPHLYNRPEEIALLLEALETAGKKGWR